MLFVDPARGPTAKDNLASSLVQEEVFMKHSNNRIAVKGVSFVSSILGALLLITIVLLAAHKSALNIYAAPIDPPEGYPKLTQSTKTVTPVLAHTGGATLHYLIEIRNTGAYAAEGVTMIDTIPAATSYNGDAWASSSLTPTFLNGVLSWAGDIGFDTTVIVSFSVNVTNTFSGVIQNSAVISAPMIAHPVTVTAETVVTDMPIFEVKKAAEPEKPGPNKLLLYSLKVTNQGQPAVATLITVTDQVPANTTLSNVGDGSVDGGQITWNRTVNQDTGETSVFTFSVTVDDVLSGTVVTNDQYDVTWPDGTSLGEVYTVTVIDPILFISKYVQPDPPGSNREMDYFLTVLNKGSQATNLTIADRVPDNVTYVTGGSYSGGVVTWDLPVLDTDESRVVSYTVYIADIAEVPVINADYEVCAAEEVCQSGRVLTSTVGSPTFKIGGYLDPIAKKPGGGGGPVTPTLTVENLGPGNALDATATLLFERISVSGSDLIAIPPVGAFTPGADCGDKCVSYIWVGDIGYGETITFTTLEGQNSIGGEEGTHYTATLIITDVLGSYITPPMSETVTGTVTHMANLIPTKSAPAVIGAGNLMTYTIDVFDSGLTTDVPPYPILTDTVPTSTTLISISDGGVSYTIGSGTVISWTLPSMGPGDRYQRSFTVRVFDDLISGTQIVNQYYGASWYNIYAGGILSNTGVPVTTTVKEIGLIDSFKTVTPALVSPGSGNILTYTVHVVNSSPMPLSGVHVYDELPWQSSTYQRDAVASAGQIVSDIVSIDWTGDIAPFSSELITFSVLVDPDFSGAVTNTAVITHTSLREEVIVQAVAYVTDKPVLFIEKTATPNPVILGGVLLYTINVTNLGQQATNLIITDVIPADTEYVLNSASSGGLLTGDRVQWQIPVLLPGDQFAFTFKVNVLGGEVIVNDQYQVTSAENVSATGAPVYTTVYTPIKAVYLPLVRK
jgi:uncharacterized repeat protein (TIGR01451 family)